MTEDSSLAKTARGACQRCRMRKLRCDVLRKGMPCSNCVPNGNECIYLPSKRRRYWLSHMISVYEDNSDADPSKYRPPVSPPQPHPQASGLCYLDNSASTSSPPSTKLLGSSLKSRGEDQTIESIEYVIPEWDLRFLLSIPLRSNVTSNERNRLPSYIKPLPTSMSSEHLAQMISNSVFD